MKIIIALVASLAASAVNAGPVYIDDGLMTDAKTSKQSIYATDSDGTLWILDSDEPRHECSSGVDYYSNKNDRKCKLHKRAGLSCKK